MSFDPFGVIAKQKRKEKVELRVQADSQQIAVSKLQQEQAAVEGFRVKIAAKLEEVARVARDAAVLIESVRKSAQDPLLEGDPALIEVDKNLADLEEGLVQIQTGTVVDTGTLDTNRLAISYTDAQGALVGMTALKTRATGLSAYIRQRILGVKDEQAQAVVLKQQRAVLAEQEARRQEALDRELDLKRRREAWAQSERDRDRAAAQVRDLDQQIAEERRVLERAKIALFRFKSSMTG